MPGMGIDIGLGISSGAASYVPPPVTLAALSLSSQVYNREAAAGTLIGMFLTRTSGSTITVDPSDGRIEVNNVDGSLRVGATPGDAEAIDYDFIETHPDATNSPRTTTLTITATEDEIPPGGGTPNAAQFLLLLAEDF